MYSCVDMQNVVFSVNCVLICLSLVACFPEKNSYLYPNFYISLCSTKFLSSNRVK